MKQHIENPDNKREGDAPFRKAVGDKDDGNKKEIGCQVRDPDGYAIENDGN